MTTLSARNANMGVAVDDMKVLEVPEADIANLRESVYANKIVVLRNQDLSPADFVAFGRRLGEVDTYYEPMYHHPEYEEIFISSNVKAGGKQVGVPGTGSFWHHDYSFMPRPFGLTLVYPQVIPQGLRGTLFIDMEKAYEELPEGLKAEIEGTRVVNSVRRYFKVRPADVYRPISEIIAEIEEKTPAVTHPAVFPHPVTGNEVLYISEAVSHQVLDADGNALRGGLLDALFEAVGQADTTFTHPNIHLQAFDEGDLLIWDNRSLAHRAVHTPNPEPTVSFRLSVHDEYEFYPGIGQ